MLRIVAIVAVLAVLAPAGYALAARAKVRAAGRPPRSGPPTGLGARIKSAFFGRKAKKQQAQGADPRATAGAEAGRWMELAMRREPTRTRSPMEWRLSNFRPRSRPGGGNSVVGVGARAVWVEGDVALIRTDPGPDIFLPTGTLDAAGRARLVDGARLKVDVVLHATGGVVATNPRFDD